MAITNGQTSLDGKTLKVNAGYVAVGQSAKAYVGRQATSITAATPITLGTVTPGKLFIITDILISSDAPSGSPMDIQIQGAGVTIFRMFVHGLTPISACGLETQPAIAAGQVITLLLPMTGAVQNVTFSIFGIEQ